MKYYYCKLGMNYWLYPCNFFTVDGELIPAMDRAIAGEFGEGIFRRKSDMMKYISENNLELI